MPSWIEDELAAIATRGEFRELEAWSCLGPFVEHSGRRWLNLAGNDYLGLTLHPAVRDAAVRAIRDVGPGATASRLLAGSCALHGQLEDQLAAWKGHPASLLFSSGYMAALGVITTLVGRGDLVAADRLSHACLIDAARLSGATLVRFHHNDMRDAERCLAKRAGFRRCLVMTESVFSMDGDVAPLPSLLELAGRHDCLLLVDEAHALGTFGQRGAGLTADAPEAADRLLTLGTLGKSLASAGGFVTCSAKLRQLFINRARSFIFDTAPPPATAAAASAALSLLQAHPEWPDQLQRNAERFAAELRKQGCRLPGATSHIIPVALGHSALTMRVARAVREHGVVAAAVRPPSVPANTARLRLSVSLAHPMDALIEAARAIGQVCRTLAAQPETEVNG